MIKNDIIRLIRILGKNESLIIDLYLDDYKYNCIEIYDEYKFRLCSWHQDFEEQLCDDDLSNIELRLIKDTFEKILLN